MRILNFILLAAFIMLQISCRSTGKFKTDKSFEIQYYEVALPELIKNKHLYHNKAVQVKAYYLCSFEKSAILEELILPSGFDDSKKYYDWGSAVWIDEKYSKTNLPCDSLRERIITVRGIYDTTQHGHLGDYIATIKQAILIK